MHSTPWNELLMQWSTDILASELVEEKDYLITPEMIATQWLGYAGATEAQILAAEARLGSKLPPSYRAFLSVTNGWSVLTQFAGQLWSTNEVGWLRDKDPMLIDICAADDEDVPDVEYFVYGKQQDAGILRTRYFHTALQISNPQYLDGECYLLNPQVVTPDGEWEAWFFASWLPGAIRYRSFWELMQGEYERFLQLKDS